jgi:putative transcriptional regulator
VPSKSKKLNAAELSAMESTRDIGTEILQSIKDMKAGKGRVVLSAAAEAREATGLSQSQFASLLGVSVRTLQGWEQGRETAERRSQNIAGDSQDQSQGGIGGFGAVVPLQSEAEQANQPDPQRHAPVAWRGSLRSLYPASHLSHAAAGRLLATLGHAVQAFETWSLSSCGNSRMLSLRIGSENSPSLLPSRL